MNVPCHTCIVKASCMNRVEKITYNKRETYYMFDDLLQECEQLRQYFGLDTPTNRVKLKIRYKSFYKQSLGSLINDERLVRAFLKVMHKKKMPTTEYPVIRIKKKKVVIK